MTMPCERARELLPLFADGDAASTPNSQPNAPSASGRSKLNRRGKRRKSGTATSTYSSMTP